MAMKSESYHPVPSIRHARENVASPGAKKSNVESRKAPESEGGDHGEVQKFEHFHPDHPDNPTPGSHHTIAHHEDGHQESREHEDAQGAMQHHEEAMGGQNQGMEICPKCGGEMEGGTCQSCGYTEESDADSDSY